MAEFTGFADVLHAYRLTANGVVCHGENHKRHIALVLFQHFLKLLEADIALEGDFKLCIIGLRHGDIDGESLTALDVTLSSIEVGIARHNHTRLHEVAEQHILGCTALVGWDDILETSEFGDGVLHVIERTGTAVALIALHHSGPLTVTHGASTAIGQQVDVDIVALQHKYILVGFVEPLLALFAGGFLNGFNHLDFPRFCKW